MILTTRTLVVLKPIGSILPLGDILLMACWLTERGVVDWARGSSSEDLTPTEATFIAILLRLLGIPKAATSIPRCPVRVHVLVAMGCVL